MKVYCREELEKTVNVFSQLLQDEPLQQQACTIAAMMVERLRNDGKILFAGNGGSAADAQHLAGELVSKLCFDRPGLAAIALTTDTSILTAIGNDYGYERLFARQVEALGRSGDVLVAFSTSGRSPNILRGLEAAKEAGMITVGFTGHKGGDMLPLCDYVIQIPSDETPKIQEGHIALGHIICALVERAIFRPE